MSLERVRECQRFLASFRDHQTELAVIGCGKSERKEEEPISHRQRSRTDPKVGQGLAERGSLMKGADQKDDLKTCPSTAQFRLR